MKVELITSFIPELGCAWSMPTNNYDYTIVSADAMNKIHVGTLAVSR